MMQVVTEVSHLRKQVETPTYHMHTKPSWPGNQAAAHKADARHGSWMQPSEEPGRQTAFVKSCRCDGIGTGRARKQAQL